MGCEFDTVPLGEVATVRSGFAFKSSDWAESGVPVVKIANVKNGNLEMDGCSFVPQQVADQASDAALSEGDILIAMTGYIGEVARVRARDLPAAFNQRVGRFAIRDRTRLDGQFLFYLLRDGEVRRGIEGLGYGSAQPNVSPTLIHGVEVTLPPLPEQKRIAHILGTLDDKIELNRRMCRTLEEMARALFKSWFVDFDPVRAKAEGRQPAGMDAATAALFPDSFVDSELGPIPRGWEVKRLEAVFEINPSRPLAAHGEAPYVDMQNVPTSGHSVLGSRPRVPESGSRFTNGDTLLARITPCLENGKTAYVDFLQDGEVAWGSTEFIVLRPKPPLPPVIGYLLARDDSFREFAIQSMTGSSGRQRVPTAALAHYRVAVPPAPVAERFGNLTTAVFERARCATRENNALAAQRDALLPGLVNGMVASV